MQGNRLSNETYWICSQCGKKCGINDARFEDGVCEKCDSEALRVICPVCEGVYTDEDDIFVKKDVKACYMCLAEMAEDRKKAKREQKTATKGIKKVRKNM